MDIRIQKRLGRYNLCSYEKQWMVEISGLPEECPARRISEHWNEEDEPEIDGLPPSEVVELMEDQMGSYLFYSARAPKMEVIQWIKAHRDAIDAAWAKREIKNLERRITRLQDKIEHLKTVYIDKETS
jgi:hypothetical protein